MPKISALPTGPASPAAIIPLVVGDTTYQAPADIPTPAAPTSAAIIASRQTLLKTGAPLKMILGSNYSSGNDAAATLDYDKLLNIAGEGYTVTDPDVMDMKLNSQVLLPALTFDLGRKTRFRRNFSDVGNRDAVFVNHTDGVRLQGLHWRGGTFDMEGEAASTSLLGSWFTLDCDDSSFVDMTFLNWQQGHVMFGRGDRNTCRGIRFKTTDLDPDDLLSIENAGWRWSEGDYNTFTIDYGECRNDVLMWVLAMEAGGTDWLRHNVYVNCVTKSLRAKAGTIGASQNGGVVEEDGDPDSQYQGGIYECGFRGCRSAGSGSNFYRIIADGSARRNMIDQCFVDGFAGYLDSDNPGTDGLEIEGLEETTYGGGVWSASGSGYGSVGTIRLNGIDCIATNTYNANVFNAPGARIFINGMRANADRTALTVNEAALVELSGALDFTGLNTSDGSGDANEKHVVKTDTAFTGLVDFVSKPVINGIPSTKSAFKIRGGKVRLRAGAVVNKASGATTTSFADVSASATLEYLDDITGTADTLTPGGSGTIRKINAAGSISDAGNWTPELADASTGGNTAGGSISGTYTVIGDTVTLQIRAVNITTAGMTGGNALYIRALPVAIRTGNANNAVAAVSCENVTFSGALTFWGEAGTTYGRIYMNASGTTRTALTVAGLTSGSADIYITVIYTTD